MTAPNIVTIDQALIDRKLLGAALGELSTWQNWRSILKSIFALPLGAGERELFGRIAGGRQPPSRPCKEAWIVAGRRSGKSRMAALVGVYLATFRQYHLSPGEVGHVLILAGSKAQAKTVFSYCKGFIESSAILSRQLLEATADELRLRGNIVIAVHPNSFRSVRGRTLVAAVLDETSYWVESEEQPSALEAYRALLPALMTTQGLLISISSPYWQRGLQWEKWNQHYGKDGDVLVIQAESRLLNSTLDQRMIADQIAQDPEAGRSEWEASWRGDLAAYIGRDQLARCVAAGTKEIVPQDRFKYFGFVDMSGGQHDSSALGIAFKDADRIVLAATRECKAPHEPQAVVSSFVELLRRYRIQSVKADRYASGWAETAFRAQGIAYMPSERSASEIFRDALPLFMNGEAQLLDDARMISQIANLERRTSRTGDQISHPRSDHDDLAVAVCGSLLAAAGGATWERSMRDLPTRANTSGGRHPKPGRAPDKPQRQDRPGPGGLYR
jgi:hypothetical protein